MIPASKKLFSRKFISLIKKKPIGQLVISVSINSQSTDVKIEPIFRVSLYFPILVFCTSKSEFLKLTEKEIQILIELGNSKITSSKKHLLEKVWKYNPNIRTSTVETHIHRLRKKLIRFSKEKITIKYGRYGYYII